MQSVLKESVEKMKEEGLEVPALGQEMLDNGNESFYKEENGDIYFYHNGEYYTLVRTNRKGN